MITTDFWNQLLHVLGVDLAMLQRAALLEVICWAMMLVATLIDMRTGLRKADVLHQKRSSHGYRRTFQKFGDYGKVTALGMCIDIMAMVFSIWTVPYASAVSAVGAILIEARSVRENLKIIKSAAADVPDLVAQIAKTTNVKDVIKLLQDLDSIRERNAKHSQPKKETSSKKEE